MRKSTIPLLSLPDRLAHDFFVGGKFDSPNSAPPAFEKTRIAVVDSKDESLERKDSADASTAFSQFPQCVSTGRSFHCLPFPSHSPISTLTSELLRENEAGADSSQAIDLSLKFLHGNEQALNDPRPQSEASMMPGVCYKPFHDFSHSNLLISNISKSTTPSNGGSQLISEITITPGAGMNKKLRESKARAIVRRRYQESKQAKQGTRIPRIPPSFSLLADLDQTITLGSSQTLLGGHVVRFPSDESEIEPPSAFKLAKKTKDCTNRELEEEVCEAAEEGEEHTLDAFEENIASMNSEKKQIEGSWSKEIIQPDLQDPTGLLLVVDRMLDCFDRPGSNQLFDLSLQSFDEKTLDSSFDEQEWEATMEKDGVDWLFPCCNDVNFDQELRELFEEETTLDDESSRFERLESKGRKHFCDGSISTIEQGMHTLSLKTVAGDQINQTTTTDGESTVGPDLLTDQVSEYVLS